MTPSPQWKMDGKGNYTIHERDLILSQSGKVMLPFAGKVNYYEFRETRGSGDNILYKQYVFTGPGSRKTTYTIDHSTVPMVMSINEDYEYEKPGGFDHMST